MSKWQQYYFMVRIDDKWITIRAHVPIPFATYAGDPTIIQRLANLPLNWKAYLAVPHYGTPTKQTDLYTFDLRADKELDQYAESCKENNQTPR